MATTLADYDLNTGLGLTDTLVQHAGWSGDGKNILPTFQKAATAAYGLKGKSSAPTLNIGINSAPASVLKLKADAKLSPVPREPERLVYVRRFGFRWEVRSALRDSKG